MIQIVEKPVDVELPLDAGLSLLIAQLENHIVRRGRLYRLEDPEQSADMVRSILRFAQAHSGARRLHFILLPESSVPAALHREIVETVREGFPENTVVVYGCDHVTLAEYAALLEEDIGDNIETAGSVRADLATGDPAKPVNTCRVVVKERSGRVRCFLFAKTHPFAGEESLDEQSDLYQGKTFLLFRCSPVPFNFMPVLCFDYVYRDLRRSNIMAIIERANRLYFDERQQLDMLLVIQCNPAPEHVVFQQAASGFYGERLFMTPGTRDSITVFVNAAAGTRVGDGVAAADAFGRSSLVCGERHRLPRIQLSEFRTDDFDGAPVCRLRFERSTRLYVCRFFPRHEADPRFSRTMLKVTEICRPVSGGAWEKVESEDLVMGVSGDGT